MPLNQSIFKRNCKSKEEIIPCLGALKTSLWLSGWFKQIFLSFYKTKLTRFTRRLVIWRKTCPHRLHTLFSKGTIIEGFSIFVPKSHICQARQSCKHMLDVRNKTSIYKCKDLELTLIMALVIFIGWSDNLGQPMRIVSLGYVCVQFLYNTFGVPNLLVTHS